MSDGLDDETLDPRSTRREVARVPVLRQVYDGGSFQIVDRVYPLKSRSGFRIGRAADGDVTLTDPRASRAHATLRHVGVDKVELENQSRHGTHVGARLVTDRTNLSDGDVLTVGESLFVLRWQPAVLPEAGHDDTIVGPSQELADVRANVRLIAPTEATVLVTGETGVGKEVVARAIHEASGRAGPFVPVNCAAIAESLAESELFGHKAGAFTGAKVDHRGFFQQAAGGTLFLDELGELPETLQPKLLRVLDDKKVQPVGSSERMTVDVRLVCATNRDLEHHVASGRFRGDLYARVAELTMELPPLRRRPEDVLPLLRHALGEGAPPLAPELANALLLHTWPFNVRELFKVATELKVRGAGAERLELELVEGRLKPPPAAADTSAPAVEAGRAPDLGQVPEREEVLELLTRYKGVIADIARETGRSRKQVYRWLKKYELDASNYRDDD